MKMFRAFACWTALHSTVVFAQLGTLRELLAANAIPPSAFSKAELDAAVQGSAKADDSKVVLVYWRLKGELFFGHPQLASYGKDSGKVFRSELPIGDSDLCSGSPAEVTFIQEFALVSFNISPSAECLFVVDRNLKQRQLLYGFGPVEVAPAQVVIIEDMVHFAPNHPERLQLADLHTGKTLEVYPPKDDPARAELAKKNKNAMPVQEVCARMNDPCDPEEFDEDIVSFVTNGKEDFAFLASQHADHATVAEEPAETVASQLVLYLYQRSGGTWKYCEQKIDDSEKGAAEKYLQTGYGQGILRCNPNLPVIPDLSTAAYNPFMRH